MKQQRTTFLLILFGFLLAAGCSKKNTGKDNPPEAVVPIVVTMPVSSVTSVSATCGGSVTSDGGASVTERGVIWNTSENPTIESCTGKTTDGDGTGDFVSSITGLTATTSYYVRAYATNSAGTTYGEQQSFFTLEKETAPMVTTASITSITNISATCGGSVTSDGGASVTERGVIWSTAEKPTVESCIGKTIDSCGTGDFVSSITGLTASTTYYVCAYATNTIGTTYGEQQSFITADEETVPTIITASVTFITTNSASCGGNVTSDGGTPVTVRGVVWSISQNPTVESCTGKTTNGGGTGTFTSTLTGLSISTKYYVKAYATNSIGTDYGDEISFVTSAQIEKPTVTTSSSVSSITSESAISGGNVLSDGGARVSARGVVWGKSQNPTIESCIGKTTNGSGTGIFSSSLTGLTGHTTYYIRAYATNSAGTSYGERSSFITNTGAGGKSGEGIGNESYDWSWIEK